MHALQISENLRCGCVEAAGTVCAMQTTLCAGGGDDPVLPVERMPDAVGAERAPALARCPPQRSQSPCSMLE